MINITIELHSAIDGHKEILSKIEIYNDTTGNQKIGNYTYQIYKKAGGKWKSGKIIGFPRKQLTVNHLLKKVLEDAFV